MIALKTIRINTASPAPARSRVTIIYTGGTFGMVTTGSGTLIPFDFSLILEHLPALKNLFLEITVISFEKPIDSSNIEPQHWQAIGKIIMDRYEEADGFVVLHGTDTMAYTASALSFMLKGLTKPVIFTGAQLPISEPRSDARENLITALEIASTKVNGVAVVPEVCIFFDFQLLRGNRSKKSESLHFNAFESENYPPLATAGVKIEYNHSAILSIKNETILSLKATFESSVAILKLFPGIQPAMVESVLSIPGLKGVVLETFGAGNAPTAEWFILALKKAIDQNLLILNVSQCPGGMVLQGRYGTSKLLKEIGVLSGGDMTTEAALAKMMLLLGEYDVVKAKELISLPMNGELTGD